MDDAPQYPAPQADRLSTVVAVVGAVASGCDTAQAASEAIGMVERQGAYYTNAAATLGWLTKDAGSCPVTWQLTDSGAALTAASPADQVEMLIDTLLSNEYAAGYDPADGGRSLEADLCHSGLDADTAARRVQTLRSWWDTASLEPEQLLAALAAEQTAVTGRVPAARATADQQRAEARAARAVQAGPVYGSVCPSCFMTMPLSGACPNCA